MGSASKVLLRRKSTASGGASAHCCPGALHAWPKVTAPTARAPARWRRSTAGVVGRSGVAPVAFRRKFRSEKWRRRHAVTLYQHDSATLNDIRGAVATLEDTQRTARRVLGSAHPLFGSIERDLQNARATLRARESGQSVVFNPR